MARKKLTAEQKARRCEYMRAWAVAHREQSRAANRKSYEAHREKRLEKQKERYRKHAKAICAQARKYHSAHPEQARAAAARWRAAHPEKAAEARNKWVAAHPDQDRENHRRWFASNPGKKRESFLKWSKVNGTRHHREYLKDPHNRIGVLISYAKIRAKKRGLPFDAALGPALKAKPPAECCCCHLPLNYSGAEHPDRARCASLDRFDNAKGYTIENVRIICYRCNDLKRNASVEELENIIAYMRAEGH